MSAGGGAYGYLAEYEKAIADFDNAIDLDPADPAAYGLRGLAYSELGETDRAIADLEKALSFYADPADKAQIQQLIDGIRGR